MYEYEGTTGGAKAAGCGNGGKGTGGLCMWFRWGGGAVDDKVGKTTREMLGRAHLNLGGG